ncbi:MULTISPECIES: hypothetical protein [unclassified Actinoplanes]|uniref:hypothetical protein n=1 Tax=unclassified Actinoplanes TaxID=2626549 RepID=UPI0012BA649E|nr:MULTISPECIES: hypothetical protein [unclassified Actinoplanes]
MDSETYFAASAQILPALMIPIWIENIHLARQRALRIMAARRRIEELWESGKGKASGDFTTRLEILSRSFDKSRNRHRGGIVLAVVSSVVFILGEAGAIYPLLEPHTRPGSFDVSEPAKWTTVGAIALLSVLVAFFPFLRYPRTGSRKDPEGYRPQPVNTTDVQWELP